MNCHHLHLPSIGKQHSNLPAVLVLSAVGPSEWKWENFLQERLKLISFFPDFLISWVLWDNAGEEGADLGLRTPPSTILGGSVATREAAS